MNRLNDPLKRYGLFLWGVICAFVLLLFTTRSSVLFVCNNWDDANSYFTMGKGMMNGLVIYRDLYDQKGPYLYLLYGFAYLISHKTFLGVFIFEIISGAFFLFFSGKLIQRKSSAFMAAILMPVLGAAAFSSWSFYFGGAAEEFCLPLLAYSLLVLDELLHEECSDERYKWIFSAVGLCAGVIAQIKYTMLGFLFAWFVVAAIWALKERNAAFSLKMMIRFVIFACIPSVPWFIYFLATGSLDDWFRCYIYNNLFFYSQVSTEEYSFGHKLYEIAKTLYWLIQDSFSYFVFIIAGFLLQLFMEKGFVKRVLSPWIFAVTYFVIFIGGNKLAYYSIPLIPLAVFGLAYMGSLIEKALSLIAKKRSKEVHAVIAASMLAAGAVFAVTNSMNAEYMSFDEDDVWLMEAATMLSEEDTLLELNTVDAGLYTVTGIVPTCEYFQTNGIGLDTMFEEQEKYLKEARTDYVLAVGYEPEHIYNNYSLIKVFEYKETDHDNTYYLYKKN
ncbi:hypothetical protein [Butyrivibrio sp. MC2021]|uniref:hypothetical protein n=1 Tax=Butyrivibrio sp. MC2021 TaxID=1408306 RepID=UPI00047ECCAB|nr:hypothetical protein [Butyrivibrio sp. MC2021]